ncbi:MAG: hypothetical protein QOH97_3924 [Actinoplanes sp.]|jgi:hypothetical protein|nr:hypothetical protein [Actinoplanes sp.]
MPKVPVPKTSVNHRSRHVGVIRLLHRGWPIAAGIAIVFAGSGAAIGADGSQVHLVICSVAGAIALGFAVRLTVWIVRLLVSMILAVAALTVVVLVLMMVTRAFNGG